jgi:hypothetical protein
MTRLGWDLRGGSSGRPVERRSVRGCWLGCGAVGDGGAWGYRSIFLHLNDFRRLWRWGRYLLLLGFVEDFLHEFTNTRFWTSSRIRVFTC